MRYDGYDSDTAVATTTKRRREICRSFTCITPWFIFWRWFNGGKSRVSRNRFVKKNWGEEKMEGRRKSGIVSSSFRQDVSDIPKEASFNVGVGFGLIYLVKHELNKMVELRKRVELLIQDFHTEDDNQETKQHYMPSRSSVSSSLSKTHVQGIMYDEEHDSGRCVSPIDVTRSRISFGSNRFRQERSLRMDQLEAELEAELGRLQLQMNDGGFILNYSQQPYPEEYIEDSAPELVEEISDRHEMSNDEFYGVSPRDLERRLLQVLEERKLERINELESALDYAMQQLEEKERELCWWKDSARLVAQRLPFVPSLLREFKQAMEEEYAMKEMGKSLINNSISECNI
ncbi:hypothetical protein ACS0TY_012123 [Phlomoides rotata]